MIIMKKPIILFLFIGILFSCSGSLSNYLLAVTSDQGALVGIEVSLSKGSGDTYISIDPLVGMSTQDSIKTAVNYAFSLSGEPLDDCDIRIKFQPASAEYIEGPSAGGALTVFLFSLLSNHPVREDALMTGAVSQFGTLDPVGGIYEKSLIAINNDYKYVLFPKLSVHEKVLLSELKSRYDIQFIEVSTIEEAIDFMIYKIEINDSLNVFEPEKIFEVEPYKFMDEDLESFKSVTLTMIKKEKSLLNSYSPPEGLEGLTDYFSKEIENQQTLVDNNYVFTSANSAFLNYIELATIANAENLDLELKKKDVEECLNSLPKVKKTRENFEWVISSELREYWAKRQINSIILEGPMLKEEKYIFYNDLMYADAWCEVSKSLRKKAQELSDGSEISDMVWKDTYDKIVLTVDQAIISPEYIDHIESASLLYSDGKYGAAIYDILFAIEVSNAIGETQGMSEEVLLSNVQKFYNESATSLWGKIYHTQGSYLAQGDLPSAYSSYNIFKYSQSLDLITQDMINLLPEEKEESLVNGILGNNCQISYGIFALVFAVFLLRRTC